MNVWKPVALVAVAGLVVSLGVQVAQAAGGHPNITAAHDDLVNAKQHIAAAQTANEFDLGGHAAKAKDLINQAEEQARLARDAAK